MTLKKLESETMKRDVKLGIILLCVGLLGLSVIYLPPILFPSHNTPKIVYLKVSLLPRGQWIIENIFFNTETGNATTTLLCTNETYFSAYQFSFHNSFISSDLMSFSPIYLNVGDTVAFTFHPSEPLFQGELLIININFQDSNGNYVGSLSCNGTVTLD